MKSGKLSSQPLKKVHLFVYGTLRKGGVAASYLLGQRLLQQNRQLPGFAMYDAGWYPFVIPAGPESVILGDVYEVDQSLMPTLDAYEGDGYVAHFLEQEKILLYLKADERTQGFEKVEEGDWLSYWENKKR